MGVVGKIVQRLDMAAVDDSWFVRDQFDERLEYRTGDTQFIRNALEDTGKLRVRRQMFERCLPTVPREAPSQTVKHSLH